MSVSLFSADTIKICMRDNITSKWAKLKEKA